MAKTVQLLLTAGWISSFGLLGIAGLSDRSLAQETPEAPPQEIPEESTQQVPDARFSCQVQNGQPTVMYAPVSQPGELYPWAVPEDMGSAWPAERRCTEISRRLEEYRPDGLVELQNDVENGYNTVCVTTEAVSGCRIVFTVPPGQDPQVTRDSVFNNLVLADQGDTTQGVITFTGEDSSVLDDINEVLGLPAGSNRSPSSNGINLKPFLDPADGGTGAQLSNNTGRPLNPDNF